MNLQDYNKWQDWDHNLSVDHTESATKQFPLWICTLAAIGAAALWAITIIVEFYEWLRNGDPIEIMVALWVVVCMGLFLTGMLAAVWNY